MDADGKALLAETMTSLGEAHAKKKTAMEVVVPLWVVLLLQVGRLVGMVALGQHLLAVWLSDPWGLTVLWSWTTVAAFAFVSLWTVEVKGAVTTEAVTVASEASAAAE